MHMQYEVRPEVRSETAPAAFLFILVHKVGRQRIEEEEVLQGSIISRLRLLFGELSGLEQQNKKDCADSGLNSKMNALEKVANQKHIQGKQ